jgi:hypothetical protein
VELIGGAEDSPVIEPKMFSLVQTEMADIDSNYPLTSRFRRKVTRRCLAFRQNSEPEVFISKREKREIEAKLELIVQM